MIIGENERKMNKEILEIGAEVKIEEVKKIGSRKIKEKGIVVAELRNAEQKKEV